MVVGKDERDYILSLEGPDCELVSRPSVESSVFVFNMNASEELVTMLLLKYGHDVWPR